MDKHDAFHLLVIHLLSFIIRILWILVEPKLSNITHSSTIQDDYVILQDRTKEWMDAYTKRK
jgi:hypothetical protein